MKDYNGMILITKEEKITGSPFCLRLDSLCGDGYPLTGQMTSFSVGCSQKVIRKELCF